MNEIIVTYSQCVCLCACVRVALVIQHAKRMRCIVLLSVVCPYVQYFSIFSDKL